MSEKRPGAPGAEQPDAKRARHDTNGSAQPAPAPAGEPAPKANLAEIQAKLAKVKAALEGPRLKAQLERLQAEKAKARTRLRGAPPALCRP